MNAFWIGVCIMLIGNFFNSLPTIITLNSWYLGLRKVFYWLPFNISLAFLSGFCFYLVISEQNQFGRGSIVILIILVDAFIACVLEHNFFIIKKAWQEMKWDRIKNISYYLYIFSFVIALLPYLIYSDIINANYLIYIILVPIFFIFTPIWNFIYKSACQDVQYKLQKILESFCRHSYASFTNVGDGDTFFHKANIEELNLCHGVTCKSLERIYYFKPVNGGNIIPGVENNILPIKKIEMLSGDIEKKFLEDLSLKREKLMILLGDDAEAQDNFALVAKKCGKKVADKLMKRRRNI